MPRRIFGPMKQEVTRSLRKVHNKKLHNLYSPLCVIRMINGKRPLRRSRHRREDNIKIDHKEVGWENKDWFLLVQDMDQWQTLVNTVMNLQVP
jgi:ribosomal protein L16 Arg81 hydroxylase